MIATIQILLAKDLARVRRNPVPVLIFLGVPFLITAVIGAVFGGMNKSGGGGLEPIKVAIVDEDKSNFTDFLKNATGGEDFRKNVDAQFVERDAAMDLINANEISAVLIIPKNFTEELLSGSNVVRLTLIKNPAQSIYPAFAQAGVEILVTSLNALARNFRDDVREIVELFESESEIDVLTGVAAVSGVLLRSVDRVEAARDYLAPPLVTYKTESRDGEQTEDKGPGFSLFSFLLIGMSSMFLLMLADNTMKDLYREAQFRTLERFRTLNQSLFTFIAAKVIYSIAILLIGSVILFGGGALVFQFQWQNIPQVIVLVLCYCLFGAGMMGFIAALAGKERRADVLNNIVIMAMALLGGAMWPPEEMPPIVRDHITSLLPTFWFSSAVRGLQSDYQGFDWVFAAGLLVGLGILFTAAAAWLFRARLEKGVKA